MRKKSEYGMPPPKSRAEMEHNVYLTIDEINRNVDDDSFIQNRIWALGNSLKVLKTLPIGRINMPTVDEQMRCHSNMMDWIKYLPESFLNRKF